MGLNASKLTSVYFCELKLFNGLRARQLEKPLLRPGSRRRLWANVSNSHGFFFSRLSHDERERDSAGGKHSADF